MLSALEPGTGAVNGKSSALLLLLLLWQSEYQQIVIRKDTRGEEEEGQGLRGAWVEGRRVAGQHGWASGFDLKDVKVRNAAGTATAGESGHRNGNWLPREL